jgi:hypothetical protein
MKNIILILVLIISFSFNGFSQDNWDFINSNNGNIYSGNIKSITKIKDGYKVWIRLSHSGEEALLKERNLQNSASKNKSYNDYLFANQLWYIDCKEKRYKLTSIIFYDSNGNVIDKLDDYSLYDDVVPGTISESVFDWMCEKVKK